MATDKRVTYRRKHSYNTRSNKIRKVKTPGTCADASRVEFLLFLRSDPTTTGVNTAGSAGPTLIGCCWMDECSGLCVVVGLAARSYDKLGQNYSIVWL